MKLIILKAMIISGLVLPSFGSSGSNFDSCKLQCSLECIKKAKKLKKETKDYLQACLDSDDPVPPFSPRLIKLYNSDNCSNEFEAIINQNTNCDALDDNNRIIAKWLINKSQEQFGVGFFKNNILVINFNYQGDENIIYYGTVVYKCLNKDILEGFWSEEYGNPDFLGSENCFRNKEQILN